MATVLCINKASREYRGVARIFQRGGGWGGHTGSNNIVMAFLPRNIVGCLLKKRLTKGGGVTGTPGPPQLRPWNIPSYLPGYGWPRLAGKMKRIVYFDWLPERARCAYLSHSGYPLCPHKTEILWCTI